MKSRLNFHLFTIGFLILAACSAKEETPIKKGPAKVGIPVKVEQVEVSNEPLPISSSGILSAKEEIKLSFKIGGVVKAIYANEGQYVKEGTVLAKLEQQEITSQVNQAKAALDKAKRDLERAEKLYQDTVVTLEQVQNARTAMEVAQANVEIASFNQRYATIYAPVSGKITRRMAEQNEVLSTGSPVFLLAASNKAPVIKVGLADKDVVRLSLKDSAEVRFDAYPEQVFKAEVSEIAASSTTGIGTFEVELMVQAAGFDLKQGFFGKVKIFPSRQDAYYKLPISAVFEADKKTVYVFVPDTKLETAKKIALKTQQIGEEFLIVKKEAGQNLTQIITEGNAYLQNGSSIIPQAISSKSTLVGR